MNATSSGEIDHAKTYTLARAMEVSGLGEGAFRAMRRKGLVVRYVAGKGFVSGKELAEFIGQQGKTEK